MGSSSPSVVYAPPPPAPTVTQQPTQSLEAQTALNEVSGAQSRLNMNLGSQLDQQNKAFFTTQDIRQAQAVGGETRATIATQGEQQRATTTTEGEQQRLGTQTAGEETRKTDLQQIMQQNYAANRNHEWAQSSYHA
jgi:hypothetical protein